MWILALVACGDVEPMEVPVVDIEDDACPPALYVGTLPTAALMAPGPDVELVEGQETNVELGSRGGVAVIVKGRGTGLGTGATLEGCVGEDCASRQPMWMSFETWDGCGGTFEEGLFMEHLYDGTEPFDRMVCALDGSTQPLWVRMAGSDEEVAIEVDLTLALSADVKLTYGCE